MDPTLPYGFAIVAAALLAHVVLVFVGRGIAERMHRDRKTREEADG